MLNNSICCHMRNIIRWRSWFQTKFETIKWENHLLSVTKNFTGIRILKHLSMVMRNLPNYHKNRTLYPWDYRLRKWGMHLQIGDAQIWGYWTAPRIRETSDGDWLRRKGFKGLSWDLGGLLADFFLARSRRAAPFISGVEVSRFCCRLWRHPDPSASPAQGHWIGIFERYWEKER